MALSINHNEATYYYLAWLLGNILTKHNILDQQFAKYVSGTTWTGINYMSRSQSDSQPSPCWHRNIGPNLSGTCYKKIEALLYFKNPIVSDTH